MSLWQNLETTSGLGRGLLWLMLAFCASAVAVSVALPIERTRVRASATLFVIGLISLLIATFLPINVYYEGACIIALLALSVAVVTLSGVLVFDVVMPTLGVKPPEILCDLVLAFVYIAAALLLLSHVGVQPSGILATSTVITAAVAFSLQDTLGNVMGGLAIQLERSIAVGDWIRVNDVVGEVKAIRWRQTSIETRNWDTVVIPNSILMKSSVIVLSRRVGARRQHRQYVYFNVDYRYSPTRVIAAVDEALASGPLENVSAEPAAHCLLMDFKDSYGSYAVRYWLTDLNHDERTDSLVRCRVVFALKRQGISIAIPAYRTFQTEQDAGHRDRIESEELARRVGAISQIDLLAPLTDEERKFVGSRLHDCPFAAGETIARQGDQSHCLYIIISGNAEVRLGVEGATASRVLAKLGPGQFFGEMGLMTGDRRSASISALSDVHCFRLDKDDFQEVLRRRPEIAESISQILTTRRDELETVRDHLHGEALKERNKAAQTDMLQRIRNFFRL